MKKSLLHTFQQCYFFLYNKLIILPLCHLREWTLFLSKLNISVKPLSPNLVVCRWKNQKFQLGNTLSSLGVLLYLLALFSLRQFRYTLSCLVFSLYFFLVWVLCLLYFFKSSSFTRVFTFLLCKLTNFICWSYIPFTMKGLFHSFFRLLMTFGHDKTFWRFFLRS